MGYEDQTDDSAAGRALAEHLEAAISVADPNAPNGKRTGLPALAYYLAELMLGRDVAAGREGVPVDWATRRWAGREILDRVVGRPKAHVILGGDGKRPINVSYKTVADATVAILDCREVAAVLAPTELDVLSRARAIALQAARAKLTKLVELDNQRRSEGTPEAVGQIPVPKARRLPMIEARVIGAESKPSSGR